MHKPKLLTLILLVTLAAGILGAPAAADSSTTFRVFAEVTSQHVAPHHTFVFHQRLVRPGDRDQVVGHDKVTCRRASGVCKEVAFFPGGKIKAKGRPGGPRLRFTIVGGTGVFKDVEGRVISHHARTYNNPLTFILVR